MDKSLFQHTVTQRQVRHDSAECHTKHLLERNNEDILATGGGLGKFKVPN